MTRSSPASRTNPLSKALWYIENHSQEDLTLEDIANCAGVSRFHLLRVFGNATGQSIMKYVRSLRLGQAARRLAQSDEAILTIAMESGYASHEAFTRAFRDFFGMTPQKLRDQGHLNNLSLPETFTMNTLATIALEAPRFENGKVLLLAGLAERYIAQNSGAGIAAQWQRFAPYLGHLEGQVNELAYGVCYNFDEASNMDYLCAVEVREFSSLPQQFSRLRLTPQRYAVFLHADHISSIRSTWHAIWNDWLPGSDYEVADAPFFERYDARFDPQTGHGVVELWVPVLARAG